MMPLEAETPLQFVRGIGPHRAAAFARLGVRSVGDLLLHLPHRHELDLGQVDIADLQPETTATVRGEIRRVRNRFSTYTAEITDGTGVCTLRWFNARYAPKRLAPGAVVLASGQVRDFDGLRQIIQPRCHVFDNQATPPDRPAPPRLVGVYPATNELPSPVIQRAIQSLLNEPVLPIEEFLPDSVREAMNLVDRRQAVRDVHLPADDDALSAARRRLAFEELFLLEIGVTRRRMLRRARSGRKLVITPEIDARIRRRFPFTLTPQQDHAIAEIVADLAGQRPMNRLLQGDVGCGKTVVALYAALAAIANGRQAAIMAPTEILARQHFNKLEQYLHDSRVRRVLLSGALTPAERRAALDRIARREIDLVIGTHALLQQDVSFGDLALVVVDEQHKFGVRQRLDIRTKGPAPHYLVMTATPIPRTLAMTVFGDLDVTTIAAAPPGRGSISTRVWTQRDWSRVMREARDELVAGRQAYVVCPAIGEEDAAEPFDPARVTPVAAGTAPESSAAPRRAARVKAAPPSRGAPPAVTANSAFEKLRAGPWKGLDVALLHGRMPPEERQAVLHDFAAGRLHAVVSTTVVEVGVDVPNATLMIVENADRFGLAQLHQLRGRVGRGQRDSRCELIAYTRSDKSRERLATLTRTRDGFEIAETDLRLRGPGELLGTRQHGLPELRMADLVEHFDLLQLAREAAETLLRDDPQLAQTQHKTLKTALRRMFADRLSLLDAG